MNIDLMSREQIAEAIKLAVDAGIAEAVDAAVARATAGGVVKAAPEQQLYRPSTVAKLLDVATTTVWRWSAQGILPPAIKLSADIAVFNAAAIHEFIDSRLMEIYDA